MRVLVADADDRMRDALVDALRERAIDAIAAKDGAEALDLARRDSPDAVIADALMPRMDGFQLLWRLRSDDALGKRPFVLYSPRRATAEDHTLALELGADALVPQPRDADAVVTALERVLAEQPRRAERPAETRASELLERIEQHNVAVLTTNERLLDALVTASPLAIVARDLDGRVTLWNPAAETLFGYTPDEVLGKADSFAPPGKEREFESLREAMRNGLKYSGLETVRQRKDGSLMDVSISAAPLLAADGTPSGWAAFYSDISDRIMIQRRMQEGAEQARRVMHSTIAALGKIVETRDPYTAGHQEGVSKIAVAIAREMGLRGERLEVVRLAALMHDLGKLYVPAEILTKPGRLSEVEMNVIKIHPQVGGDILRLIEFPWPIAEIVLQHQERLDGKGYPRGLKDGEIMLEARILSVADVIEAMSHNRPYKMSPGFERALDEVESNRGKLFDPDVVDAALRLFREKHTSIEDLLAEEPVVGVP